MLAPDRHTTRIRVVQNGHMGSAEHGAMSFMVDEPTWVEPAWWCVDDRADGTGVVFTLGGEVDLSNAVPLRRAVVATARGARSPSVVVDLHRLEFIDAAGVRALLDASIEVAPTQLVLRRPTVGRAPRAGSRGARRVPRDRLSGQGFAARKASAALRAPMSVGSHSGE